MKTCEGRFPRFARDARSAILLALAVGGQAGCGREFFRNWANQDASEAVFEKSRDPRWRIELFSAEPPATSRFASPYDPDRPPAPPDDRATEALSPVPQWPDYRLLVPAEATGYLDMLEAWSRDRPAPSNNPVTNTRTISGDIGAPSTVGSNAGMPPTPPPTPPATGAASPFANPTGPAVPVPPAPPALPPGTNSGPTTPGLTPNSVPGNAAPTPPGTNPPPGQSSATQKKRDLGVTLTAFQQSGIALPVPPPIPGPSSTPAGPAAPPVNIDVPPVGNDPAPRTINDLNEPAAPPPGQTRADQKAAEAIASELAGVLGTPSGEFNEAEAAGQPRNSKPYRLTMQQAFTLALINSRIYQTNVETVYTAALAVTLARYQFTPQAIAGMSPTTATSAGFLSPSPPNTFNYATRATGAPASALNMGTVVGVGQVLTTGGHILTGFANQIVFNFIGKNSFQPRVQSFLPLGFVQPFLAGGGRAVTLEPLTLAERQLVYAIRAFALFRQQFTVQILAAGTVTNFGSAVPSVGFTGIASNDPNTGYLNVLEDAIILENQWRNISQYERILEVYKELSKGESSGISQLQVDQIDQQLKGAKLTYVGARITYRNDLDTFKQQLGMPPDVPIMIDRGMAKPFRDVFYALDDWQRDPRRKLEDLPKIVDRLPKLEDIVIDGRSVLGVYRDGKNDEDELEDLLLAVERTALEHRLDLMNQRATLYDEWRAIKVAANALQGVFNVTLSNQFVTPPTTTNPFGFLDQAKTFSLSFQAELPLVRVAQRNNFRQAIIVYERQRRALMNAEDSLKNILRNDIRSVQQNYLQYEITKQNLVLACRLKDQAFEQIVAPPATAGASQAALQTTNLTQFQNSLISAENTLVTQWYFFEQNRLETYRDMGTLPIDEWEALNAIFPSQYSADASATAPVIAGAGPARVPATASAAEEPVRR